MSDATWQGVTSSPPGPGGREGAGAHQHHNGHLQQFLCLPYHSKTLSSVTFLAPVRSPVRHFVVSVCVFMSVCLTVCWNLNYCSFWLSLALSGLECVLKVSGHCHECVMNVSWIMESRKSHRRVMKLSKNLLTNNIERSFHWTKIHKFICLLE